MEIVPLGESSPSLTPTVAALGPFDGVHRLHLGTLAELRRVASVREARVGLLLVSGGVHARARVLTSLDHRLELLRRTGLVDIVWTMSDEIYEQPAATIASALDATTPDAVMPTMTFTGSGQGRFTSAQLVELIRDRGVEALQFTDVSPWRDEAVQRLYTTRSISDLLTAGQVALANRLLGRHYEMRGVVETGDRRGRTLGFPTLNVGVPAHHLTPAEGVYAGVTILESGDVHATAISLGRRPTFYEAGWELLEAHLLDFSGDLYGTTVRVLFCENLRGQQRFASVDELVAQLRLDVALVREVDPLDTLRDIGDA